MCIEAHQYSIIQINSKHKLLESNMIAIIVTIAPSSVETRLIQSILYERVYSHIGSKRNM